MKLAIGVLAALHSVEASHNGASGTVFAGASITIPNNVNSNGYYPNQMQGGVPQQGYPQQGYPQQGYPQQGYPQQGYPPYGGYPAYGPQYPPQYPQYPQPPMYPQYPQPPVYPGNDNCEQYRTCSECTNSLSGGINEPYYYGQSGGGFYYGGGGGQSGGGCVWSANRCSRSCQGSSCTSRPASCPYTPPAQPACCMAATAECLSCSYGMSVADYCARYQDTNGCNSYPNQCTPYGYDTCPIGSSCQATYGNQGTCVKDQNQNLCSPYSQFDTCPIGMKCQATSGSGGVCVKNADTCNPYGYNNCPNGMYCQNTAGSNMGTCVRNQVATTCSPYSQFDSCPYGQVCVPNPNSNTGTCGQQRTCDVWNSNACPNGQICRASAANQNAGVCEQARYCDPNSYRNDCPAGQACGTSGANRGTCIASNSVGQSCNPYNANQCPTGQVCQVDLTGSSYTCKAQYCNPTSPNCPAGHICPATGPNQATCVIQNTLPNTCNLYDTYSSCPSGQTCTSIPGGYECRSASQSCNPWNLVSNCPYGTSCRQTPGTSIGSCESDQVGPSGGQCGNGNVCATGSYCRYYQNSYTGTCQPQGRCGSYNQCQSCSSQGCAWNPWLSNQGTQRNAVDTFTTGFCAPSCAYDNGGECYRGNTCPSGGGVIPGPNPPTPGGCDPTAHDAQGKYCTCGADADIANKAQCASLWFAEGIVVDQASTCRSGRCCCTDNTKSECLDCFDNVAPGSTRGFWREQGDTTVGMPLFIRGTSE